MTYCLLGFKNDHCHDQPERTMTRADLRCAVPKLAFSSRRLSIEGRIRAPFEKTILWSSRVLWKS